MKLTIYKFVFVISFLAVFIITVTAQAEMNKGIELYQSKDFSGAIQILKQVTGQNKDNAEAWYYLGLSFLQIQSLKEGTKALEQSVKLKPQNARFMTGLAYAALLSDKLTETRSKAEKAIILDPKQLQAYYFLSLAQRRQGFFKSSKETADRAININPDLPDFYWMKVLAAFAEGIYSGEVRDGKKLLDEVKKILESYPKIAADTEESRFIKEKLENLKLFSEAVQDSSKFTPLSDPPPLPEPGHTLLKILSKPRPSYTDAARQNQEQGVVKLLILFSSNGTIDYVLPISGLKFGLTAASINAAYKIKFEPSTENGKPISVVKQIEYSFSIY